MTRAEYMEELVNALKDYDEDFALDIIGDYRRHFDEAAADGRSEESVCEELGSVEDFIRDIPEEFKKSNKAQTEGENSKNQYSHSTSDDKPEDAADRAENADDYSDDLEKFASDLGKFVNEAGRAAIKAAKSADSVISRFSEAVSDKLNEVIYDSREETDDDDINYDGNMEVDSTQKTVNNSLTIYKCEGIRGIKMKVVDASVELVQANTDAGSITLSRPLTKKERMYMNPEITIDDDGILKVKQENKNKVFSFLYTPMSEPLTFYVTIPAKLEKINISTVSGNICVKSDIVTEKCKLSTVSGAVTVEHDVHADKVNINTVSGSIKASSQIAAKEQVLSSVSGKVKAVVAGERFSVDNVSGSIKLSVATPCSGKLSTVSGSMVINLLSDIGIDIKSSQMGGSMKLMTDKHIDWDSTEENTAHFGFSESDRHAVFGEGMARITTSSVSGSVKVYDFGKME